jgi:hypothetical protein
MGDGEGGGRCMSRSASAKFKKHADNIKFNTQNEELISIRVIICNCNFICLFLCKETNCTDNDGIKRI